MSRRRVLPTVLAVEAAFDRRRAGIALGAGVAATATVATTVGLVTGRLVGAEDNGDGYRLFCGAGLLPRTVDRLSSWKGGVVADFTVGPPPCGMSVPSSAGLVLRAASVGSDGAVGLAAIAWWYAVLVGLVVAVAAWVAAGSGPWRATVLVVPLAPLALASFSRFFVSTYAEPAGLLGAVAVACGVAALLVTGTEHRRDRTVALCLVAVGGAVAGTAKVAYLPVLAVAALVVVTVVVRERRPPRLLVVVPALVALIAVAVPVWGAAHFQQKIYEGANVHDVVFTLAVPELGPDAPAALGLPPEAAAIAGNGFFNGPPLPTDDWWVRAIRDRPTALRDDALVALAAHPPALLRSLGVGLQATTRADLPYLASGPADPQRFSVPAGDIGWSGSRGADLRDVLAGTDRPPWLPTVVVLLGLGAALAGVLVRRRAPGVARWGVAAGLGAVTAVGLVATALLGDGYFELFKHVWLAAYALLLAATCVVGCAVAAGAAWWRR